MNKVFFIALIFSAFTVTSAYSEKVEIVRPGEYYADSISFQTNQEWFGVFEKEKGFELIKHLVEIKIGESSRCCYEAKHVSIQAEEKPIFLVRGINGLKEGYLDGMNRKAQSYSRRYPGIGSKSNPTVIGLEGKEEHALYLEGSDLVIRTGAKSQRIPKAARLATSSDNGKNGRWMYIDPAGLKWVGDLNEDNHVDVLFSLAPTDKGQDEPGATLWVLFLSNEKKNGMLEKVAELSR